MSLNGLFIRKLTEADALAVPRYMPKKQAGVMKRRKLASSYHSSLLKPIKKLLLAAEQRPSTDSIVEALIRQDTTRQRLNPKYASQQLATSGRGEREPFGVGARGHSGLRRGWSTI